MVGIADGPINKIIKHVIWKLLQQQAKFASYTGGKEKQITFSYPWLKAGLW